MQLVGRRSPVAGLDFAAGARDRSVAKLLTVERDGDIAQEQIAVGNVERLRGGEHGS
jgi:hypothetical protein